MNSPVAVREFSTSVSQGWCHCRRCQRCSIQVLQKARAARSARFLSCRHAKRGCNVRSIRDTHLKAGFTLMNYSTNDHPTQLHAANDIDCCFMAILSWRKPGGPRILRKLWSNLKPNHSMIFREQSADLRERTDYPRGKTEDISRERGIESQLRPAVQRAYRDQEDATAPTVAPQDYDLRQSVRVLELQNSDLWLRRTDPS